MSAPHCRGVPCGRPWDGETPSLQKPYKSKPVNLLQPVTTCYTLLWPVTPCYTPPPRYGVTSYNIPMNHEQIRFIERLAAKAWRPEIEQPLDGWRLRYTQGVTRRGNSVFPIASGTEIPLEEKIGQAEAFYTDWGESPCFQMTEAAQPAALIDTLTANGYQDAYHTQVQTAPLAHVLENTAQAPKYKPHHSDAPSEEWFNLYIQTSGYDAHSAAMRRGILSRVEPDADFLLLSIDNAPIAVGLGVADSGWAGIYCMVTHKDHLRRGAATQVL